MNTAVLSHLRADDRNGDMEANHKKFTHLLSSIVIDMCYFNTQGLLTKVIVPRSHLSAEGFI